MKVKFERPALIRTLGKVPVLRKAIIAAHDSWLRFSCRRLWNWNNAAARKAWRQGPPALDPVQQRVLNDLTRTGVARVSFGELIGELDHWQALAAAVEEWLQSEPVRSAEAAYRQGGYQTAHFKEYLVTRYDWDAKISWDCPWLRLGIHSQLLDIASAYLGMMGRLHHVNLWNTIAVKHEGPNIGPQRWHRDPDDVRLVKVFLYFTNVDQGSGPLQYVPHSRPGEEYGRLWPARIPIDGAKPPLAEFEAMVPREKWITCCYPRGTFVFADTAGFHRGGRATTANRVLATWAFSSQASLWPRKFQVVGSPPVDLSAGAAWAVYGNSQRQPTRLAA